MAGARERARLLEESGLAPAPVSIVTAAQHAAGKLERRPAVSGQRDASMPTAELVSPDARLGRP